MNRIPIEFVYFTSFPDWPDARAQAQLRGSWDAGGRFSDQWTSIDMAREVGVDGCTLLRAATQFEPTEVGKIFEWGVVLLQDGKELWAIPTEVKDTQSTRQTRVFQLASGTKRQEYYLTHCRRLGANRRRRADGHCGIQFSVWAPNASSVEVVTGMIFDSANPERTVPECHIGVDSLAGGFISDKGHGISKQVPPVRLSRSPDGVWESDIVDPDLADFAIWDHRPYMFRIGRDDRSTVYRTDLYSRCQVGFGAQDPPLDQPNNGPLKTLEGRLSCSAVVDPDTVVKEFEEIPAVFPEMNFITAADFWQDELGDTPIETRVEDLIIYELHLGSLGFGKPSPGTLKDAIALLDHLVDLGVTAVELLPLSEFGGGAQNWGYATSHYFAIEYAGGGRDKFKHFVKACHQRGLAVIMDVVYNHYDQEADRAERAYDSPAPERDIYYWYEGVASNYSFPRGGYLSNWSTGDAPAYHEEMVRKMFISSAVSLVQEFHVDGFRVDQTTSIHAYNTLVADGSTVSAANVFGAKFLREFGRTLRLVRPGIMLMAEDHSTWDQVTQPVEQGGMGFDARWFAEFYHHLIGDTNRGLDTAKLVWVSAARCFDRPPLRMDYFATQLAQSGQAKVVYNESHDEAGNSGGGPFLDPDWDPSEVGKQYTSERTLVVAANAAPLVGTTRAFAEARCRFAYGVTVLSAGTPLFLFGEEVGAQLRFKYNRVLQNKEDYLGMRKGTGRNLFVFYAAVNRLRRRWPGLRSRNIEVVHANNDTRLIAFRRWEGAEHYLVVGSLCDVPYAQGYAFSSDSLWDGGWKEIFNSDSALFGGADTGNLGATIRIDQGNVNCIVPANGLVVFQRVSD